MHVGARHQAAVASSKYPYLDLVRGLSAQAVLVGHSLNVFFPAFFMTTRPDGFIEGRDGMLYVQNLGVLAFFTISGFLIARSASLGKDRGIGRFMLARATRILVPLAPFLVLLWALEAAVYGDGYRTVHQVLHLDFRTFAANLTMLFNNPALSIAGRATGLPLAYTPLGTAQQLWTVVIEWWIYAAFGSLFFAGRGKPWRVALSLAALSIPLFSLFTGNFLVLAWIIGAAAWFGREQIARIPRRGAVIAALSCVAVLTAMATGNDFYSLPFVMAFSSALILGNYVGHAPVTAATKFASDVSYSLYLVHFSLLIAAAIFLPALSGITAVLVMFVACNLAAWGWWLAIERHHEEVRDWVAGFSLRTRALQG